MLRPSPRPIRWIERWRHRQNHCLSCHVCEIRDTLPAEVVRSTSSTAGRFISDSLVRFCPIAQLWSRTISTQAERQGYGEPLFYGHLTKLSAGLPKTHDSPASSYNSWIYHQLTGDCSSVTTCALPYTPAAKAVLGSATVLVIAVHPTGVTIHSGQNPPANGCRSTRI